MIARYFIALLLSLAAPSLLSAQSFDCRRATRADERTICGSEVLSQLDRSLSALYALRKSDQAVARDQRLWLSTRAECNADVGCLRKAYLDRLEELTRIAPSHEERVYRYTCDVGSFSWQEQNGTYTLRIDGGKPIIVTSNSDCAKSGFRGNGIAICFATRGYADLTIRGQTTRECNLLIPPQRCDGILTKDGDEYYLASATGGDYCELRLVGSDGDSMAHQKEVLSVCIAGQPCHIEGEIGMGPPHWKKITKVQLR